MNKKALDDYDTLEWDSAKKTLLDALVAGKKAGLENHPVMARTYVHLGAVYITGFKNRDKAIQSFTRALEIDPAIQLSKGIATSRGERCVRRGQAGAGRGGANAPPAGEEDAQGPGDGQTVTARPRPRKKAPREVVDLGRRLGGEGPAGQDSGARLPERGRGDPRQGGDACAARWRRTCPVAKVFLMYQEPGKEEYTELQMTKSPKGWYVGKIPKKAVTGKSVSYYFEGRNAAGKVVVVNGEKGEPEPPAADGGRAYTR